MNSMGATAMPGKHQMAGPGKRENPSRNRRTIAELMAAQTSQKPPNPDYRRLKTDQRKARSTNEIQIFSVFSATGQK